MIVNNTAEIAGRNCSKRLICLVGADLWPHSPRGEMGKVKDIAWHGWWSNESACYHCHEPFDHCVTGTWLATLRPHCWCWYTPTVDCSVDLHTFDCIPPAEKSSGILQKTWDQTFQNRVLRSTRRYCWARERCSLGPRAASWRPRGQIAVETLRMRIFPPRRKSSQTPKWRMLE